MQDYAFTKHRIFQWLGIILAAAIIAVGYWYYQSQASTLNKSPTGSLTSGLVGYWTFDASSTTSSTATDQGSGGNNGTLTNSPQVTEGKNGQGLDFFPNGSDNNSYVTMGDPVDGDFDFGSGDFSVGFWMKGRGYSGQGSSANVILGKHNLNSGSNTSGYSFTVGNTNFLGFTIGNGTNAYSATQPLSTAADNQWHHVVGVRSGGTSYLYIDGVAVATNTSVTGSVSGNVDFIIGGDADNQRNTNSILDEVRVYNTALSSSQIQSLYSLGVSDKVNSGISQPQGTGRLDGGVALYYALDSSSGSSATDSSTNSNTGTLTNMEDGDWTTGQIGNGLDFDGTDEYITLADTDTLDMADARNFTLTGWFNRDTFAADHTILAKRAGIANTDDGYIVYIDDATDQLIFEASESSGTDEYQMSSDSTFTATGWHHFAVVWEDTGSTATTIYIDGNRESPATSGTFANVGTLVNSVAFTLGAESDAGNPFDGKLDEARVYHRALLSDEVAELYRITAPTRIDTGLKGYWSLNAQDMNNITTAFDLSGAGIHLATSSITEMTEGKVGQGVNLDGSFDILTSGADIDLYDFGDTDDMTIASWFSRRSSDTEDAIMTKRSNSGSVGYSLWIDDTDDMMYFELHDGTDEYQLKSVQTFTDTNWHHVAAVWDQDSAADSKLYVDGVEIAVTKTGTIGNIGDLSNTVNFLIGGHTGATTSNWYGLVDELRLYKRTISSGEVKALYDQGQSDATNSSTSQSQGTGRLDSGLAAYYKFDDGSGTNAIDSSTSGVTASLNNTPNWTTGQIGGAIDLNGSSQYGSAASSTATDIRDSLTISVWTNMDTLPGNGQEQTFVYKTVSGGYLYRFVATQSGGTQRILFTPGGGGANNFSSGLTMSTGTWYNFVVTYNSNSDQVSFYQNGTLINQVTDTISGGYSGGTAGTIYLGATPTPSNYLDGRLDEVRIYNRALSSDEVTNLYRLSTPTGTETGLKGYWSFNGQDMNGTTAYDRSGAANNGTLTSGPAITEGKIGQALDFDGTDDYVNAGSGTSLDDLSAITAAAWIYPESMGENNKGRIFDKSSLSDPINGWIFNIANNESNYQLGFSVDYTTTNIERRTVGSSIVPNTWQHVAVTWDGSSTAANIKLYINGAEVSYQVTTDASGSRVTDASQNLLIGETTNSIRAFDGKIDEARLYNRVLSAAEIAALYNSSR